MATSSSWLSRVESTVRTTMRYDRARHSLDRHATYVVATFIAAAP